MAGCESGNCSKEISSLPLITACPPDDAWLFGGGFTGGSGAARYGRLEWDSLKDCIGAGSNPPDDVYFIVEASGGYINPGGQVFTIGEFIGWKTRLFRNGSPVYLTDPGNGDPYFTYDSTTGVFTLSIDVALGEVFIAQAYKTA